MKEDELYVSSAEGIMIIQPKQIQSLSFIDAGVGVIGKLYWENELKFEGNAEESAKIFIKWLKELWELD